MTPSGNLKAEKPPPSLEEVTDSETTVGQRSQLWYRDRSLLQAGVIGGLSLLITVCTWAGSLGLAAAGLDPSWQAGLAIGLEKGLPFGPSMEFTYGPLGALANQVLFYGSTALAALVFAFIVTLLTTLLLLRATRRWLPLPAAFIVTWAVVAISTAFVDVGDLTLAAGILLGMAIVEHERSTMALLEIGGLSVMAGVQLLVKFSGGLVLLAIVVLSGLSGPDRRRRFVIAASLYVATVLMLWAATVHDLAHLPDFIRSSMSISVGYPSAMNTPRIANAISGWVGLVIVAFLALLSWQAYRGRPRRKQLVAILMVAGWIWVVFREGFVRNDGHFTVFFGLVLVLICGLAACRLGRVTVAASLVGLAVVSLIPIVVVGTPGNLFAPSARPRALASEFYNLVNSSRRSRLIQSERTALQQGPDGLSKEVLASLRGRTVAIEPWENMIAWEYPDIAWDPEPVLQDYSAYTTDLDQRDARFLESVRAPQRVLVEKGASVDGRYSFFEPPATEIALLCHYREVMEDGAWQVLARGSNRCGPPEKIQSRTASFGAALQVPKASDSHILAFRVELSSPLADRVEALLYKPPPVMVILYTSEGPQRYRFVSGTADDLHVLSDPPALGWSADASPLTVQSVAFAGGGWSAGQGAVHVAFYVVPFQ